MRHISFRTRLLLAFWAVVIVGLCLPTLVFHHQLRETIAQDAVDRVHKDLRFVEWSLQHYGPIVDAGKLDKWCKDMAGHLGFRITYIATGGVVLADSHVPADQVANMDNHWNRPEVVAARRAGQGISTRYSHTILRELIYAAVPIEAGGDAPPGILRIAVPYLSVKERLDQMSVRFWMILVGALLIAGLISYGISIRIEAPIQKIGEAALAIGKGDYQRRVRVEGSPEMERLAHSVNDMATRIEDHVHHLDAQKCRLETILDTMKEGVLLLDREGRIEETNRSVREIQKDPKPRKGKKLLEVFLNAELQHACDRIVEGAETEHLELRFGDDRYYDVSLVGIRDAWGLDGIVVVFHDISEFKRLERVRRDFVANVSHELRTPLTAIKGYAETLAQTECADSAETRGFLDTILRKSDHMTRMVNDLLLLTTLESRGMEIPSSPVDAYQALHAAVETCLPMANEKGIEISVDVEEEAVRVLAARDGLTQVFQNLLHNAIRYSPSGTRIRVGCDQQEKRVTFSVEDEGSGISLAHQRRVFERFYRVDKQRGSASGSTGLGLAICRHIVENFGGRIWVQSPVPGMDRGSIFFFSLNKQKPA